MLSLVYLKMCTCMSIHHLWHLEAVLDEQEVLPVAGSRHGVILQQDEERLGQLAGVVLHCRQGELQHASERQQSLCDHLGGRRVRGRG